MNLKPFKTAIRAAIADENLQAALDANAQKRKVGRLTAFESLPDYDDLRLRARQIKAQVIADLDGYLDRFIESATTNGMQVHRAEDAEEALRIFIEIAQSHNAKLVAKSKSMVSEEIGFNHALEQAGITAIETDLGEYIVQLRGERPSHIITPAVHLKREQVGALFHEKLGIPYTDDIPILTATARKILRQVFLEAEIGVSGVNAGVSTTGTLCIVTNEGNGRMCTTLPKVHVALMGIERLVPTLDDLAVILELLPRSATGQKLSVYTSLINGPRGKDDPDGPLERHIILLDNGRSRVRNSPLAESLTCLRCGACLNACPVFREISGHAYRGTHGEIAPYPGPIGSVLSPGLAGCENFGHLAQASSLCGACREACPVDIDLPRLLVQVRTGKAPKIDGRQVREGVGVPAGLKLGLTGYRLAAENGKVFGFFQGLGGFFSKLVSTKDEYMYLPAWTGWGFSKDMPRLTGQPFRKRWRNIKQKVAKAEIHKVNNEEDSPLLLTPATIVDLPKRFMVETEALGGHVQLVKEKDVPDAVAKILREKGIKSALVDETGRRYLKGIKAIEKTDPKVIAGVTGALCGIAESGSLILAGGPGRPLTASLLPEVHIAILKTSDLVARLAHGLARKAVRESTAAVVISGPSRTADIEMALTIGVHGPGEIHVLLIDDLLKR